MLTPIEAGKVLGVTCQTVRNFMRAGKLPFVKIGGRYRVKKEDVNAMLEPHNNDKSDPLK